MADYSVDDILAEIDSKKKADSSAGKLSDDYSITSILSGEDLNQALKDAKKKKDNVPAEQPLLVKERSKPVTEILSEMRPAKRESAVKSQEFPKPAEEKISRSETGEVKLADRQLKAEESFEEPEDLIDAINPFEVQSKAKDLGSVFSGDTKGIGGNELKQLAQLNSASKTNDTKEVLPSVQPIKSVEPQEDDDEEIKLYDPSGAAKASVQENANSATKETAPVSKSETVKQFIPKSEKNAAEKLTEKERRSNEALLARLNQALSKKRDTQINNNKTLGFGDDDKINELKAPTHGLNIDYGSKVIQATGVIPEDKDVIKGKSKRKLRDFVMDEDEETEEDEDESFENYDSTGQIWVDLCESHKVLRIRLALLLIITVFMSAVALIGDLGRSVSFDLFGFDITFLDRRADVQGFLFYNLIAGTVACVICSSVLISGIGRLFRLKADCDSVCAVTMLLSVICAAINIINSDSVLLSAAYVYVPVGAAGLLFNTLGKLLMIKRAKKNFRFVSGDNAKYSAFLVEENAASVFARGAAGELPKLAALRKTELLTDFLKSSYCEDKADRVSAKLVPISLLASIATAAICFLVGGENIGGGIYRALSVMMAFLSVCAPFATMFAVNVPLTCAGKELSGSDSAVLGYEAAERFSETNSVMIDASMLFPAGTVIYSNIKHCKQPNSVNNIALDQAIILAASLAIKSGSIMSSMFRDMINDKEDILVKIENMVYEDNMGILGWYGSRRIIMGSREQMKHHDIKVPDMHKVNKIAGENTETVYMSLGGEVVIMFFVELLPNPEVKKYIQQLTDNGVSIIVKTTDSIVGVAKLVEIFDISPEKVRILPYSMHERFTECTRYVSKSSGALSCAGTFSGFARALLAAKKLMRSINTGMWIMLGGAVIGAACVLTCALAGNSALLCPSLILGWNLLWLLVGSGVQTLTKY